MNKKINLLLVAASVMIVQVITPSLAFAKRKTPPKAYSFIAEGGKASQGECDGERKIPRLKKLSEYSKAHSYMGSELQDPEIKGKPGDEMWKHFFRAKPSCNAALAKTPSAIQDPAKTATKPELPPDEDGSDDEEESTTPENGETENGQTEQQP
ncbi:hypothetical protein ACES2L_10925 [Bdellovibrio bacteriovorus]